MSCSERLGLIHFNEVFFILLHLRDHRCLRRYEDHFEGLPNLQSLRQTAKWISWLGWAVLVVAACPSEGNWSLAITSHDRCGPRGDMFGDPDVFILLTGKFLQGSEDISRGVTVMCSLRCICMFILDLRYSALTPFKNCSLRKNTFSTLFCFGVLVTSTRAVISPWRAVGTSTVMETRS